MFAAPLPGSEMAASSLVKGEVSADAGIGEHCGFTNPNMLSIGGIVMQTSAQNAMAIREMLHGAQLRNVIVSCSTNFAKSF